MLHKVYIAVGSNMGIPMKNIHQALRYICEGVPIANNNRNTLSQPVAHSGKVYTSFMYQSMPMYYEEQNVFHNCVCCTETSYSPEELLAQLKAIEQRLGRPSEHIKHRYGPRLIDLDIIFYDQIVINTEKLSIPHAKMAERDFVLGPLCDLCPNFIHPVLNQSIKQLYERLEQKSLRRILPIVSNDSIMTTLDWIKRTYVMGILNITPDSFSDGGELFDNVMKAVERAKEMAKQYVDILDIGAQSTRPDADLISTEEELRRIIPVIKTIRQCPELDNIPISVDTMVAKVAREAVNAGANIINDVSGGNHDPDMFKVAADLQVPLIIMHMRGTPKTMNQCNTYNNIIEEVSNELNTQIQRAQDQGIYKWNLIMDPGIGFAKIGEQNIIILRELKSLIQKSCNLPCLLGTSRKRFIATITGRREDGAAKERIFGTAATISAGIFAGCHIVRVHDVSEMVDVVRVSDAIWPKDKLQE